jgi:hypothetical protein
MTVSLYVSSFRPWGKDLKGIAYKGKIYAMALRMPVR